MGNNNTKKKTKKDEKAMQEKLRQRVEEVKANSAKPEPEQTVKTQAESFFDDLTTASYKNGDGGYGNVKDKKTASTYMDSPDLSAEEKDAITRVNNGEATDADKEIIGKAVEDGRYKPGPKTAEWLGIKTEANEEPTGPRQSIDEILNQAADINNNIRETPAKDIYGDGKIYKYDSTASAIKRLITTASDYAREYKANPNIQNAKKLKDTVKEIQDLNEKYDGKYNDLVNSLEENLKNAETSQAEAESEIERLKNKGTERFTNFGDALQKAGIEIPEETQKKLDEVNKARSEGAEADKELFDFIEYLNDEDKLSYEEAQKKLAESKDAVIQWTNAQKLFTDGEIDALGPVLQQYGTKNQLVEYDALKKISAMFSEKVGGSKPLTEDELNKLAQVLPQIDQMIKDEKEKNGSLRTLAVRTESAINEALFFLFDDIKTLFTFALAAEANQPQLMYTAMQQRNKQIAQAETDYLTNVFKGHEQNKVWDVTKGTILDQLRETKKIDEAQYSRYINDMKEAYKSYSDSGNDFKIWYENNKQNKESSIFGVIQGLLNLGVSSDDIQSMIKDIFGNITKSKKDVGSADGNSSLHIGADMSGNTEWLGPDNESDDIGNSIFEGTTRGIIDDVISKLQSAKSEEENKDDPNGFSSERFSNKQNILAQMLAARAQAGQPVPQGAPQVNPKGFGRTNMS